MMFSFEDFKLDENLEYLRGFVMLTHPEVDDRRFDTLSSILPIYQVSRR